MNNGLALIRNNVGHGKIISFIEDELGMSYRTFVHQCKHDNITIGTIYTMIDKLEIKFEDFKVSQITVAVAEKSMERKIERAIGQLEIPSPKKLSDMFFK